MPDTSIPSHTVSYRFGPFRLRTRPLGLYRDGSKVALPVQPLRLLSLLLARGGDLVTQDQIRMAVWPDRTVDFTGSTHVAIRQIRAALGDDAVNPVFIETVPRQGYRFVASVRTEASRDRQRLTTAIVAAAVVAAGLAGFSLWQSNDAGLSEDTTSASETVRLGEYLLERTAPGSVRQSLNYFQDALSENPEDVRAHVGAARAAIILSEFDDAAAHVQRALALDPDDAGAHDVAGGLAMLRDWDWAAARQSFERTLELDPGRASAHHGLASLDALSGHFDDAIAHMEQARGLDPASTLIQADYGWFLYYAGRYEEAADMCEQAGRLEPDSSTFPLCIIRARTMLGQPEAALPALEALLDLSGVAAEEKAAILALPPPEAMTAFERWRLERFRSPGRDEPVSDVTLAYAYAHAGDMDAALVSLQQALASGSGSAPMALIDPVFVPLRQDEGFRALSDAILPER